MRTFSVAFFSGILAVAGSAAAPVWKTYTDTGSHVSISYPADYSLGSYLEIRPQEKISDIAVLNVPERFTRGTNLSPDSHISIEVSSPAQSCTPDLFQDNASGYYVETQGPITFNVSKTGDAGAGNFYENDVYAVAGSKPCIAVRYFIHSHNIGNYDPGSVRAYDAEGLIREFDAIRRTLVIRR